MRRIIAGLIVIAGLAGTGLAYAESQPADPSLPKDAASSVAPPAGRAGVAGAARAAGRAGVLKGAIHGDLLVRSEEGTTRTIVFDRGRITALAADAITVERPDGQSVSAVITSDTKFIGTPKDQLKPGVPVIVVQSDGKAERIMSKGASREDRAKACSTRRLCQRLQQRQAA